MKFIDLFAGCGGLSLGLTNAGFRGIFAVEKNEDAFQTLRHNLCDDDAGRFDWPDWLPCEAISTSDLIGRYSEQLASLRDKVDLIAGGPPCQGFSFAGRRNPADPRNKLKGQYIKIVDLVRPKFLLFENVRGFSAPFKGSDEKLHSDQVKEALEQFPWGGYNVFSQVLNASIFGVPQPRARFILIAMRRDLTGSQQCPFAEIETFAKNFRLDRNLNGHEISVKEAISDLEIASCGVADSRDNAGFHEIVYQTKIALTPYQKLMRMGVHEGYAPNSLRLANHRPDTLMRFAEILSTCPKGIALSKEFRDRHGIKKQCFVPLHPDKMSRTITTLPDDLLHYSEPRILTVRENARLQSFPDTFNFLGKYTTGGTRRKEECPRYTQVGNAVPPLMAEALGARIIQMSKSLS